MPEEIPLSRIYRGIYDLGRRGKLIRGTYSKVAVPSNGHFALIVNRAEN